MSTVRYAADLRTQSDQATVAAVEGLAGAELSGDPSDLSDVVITFRLERPLYANTPDRGVMRDGGHYHTY